jgi:exopolyphosphatase/guanosine-5'-triphosphate,3'-diphosphate pyrophosphatase
VDSAGGAVPVAAFDIGSNSIKMTVATVTENGAVTEGYSAIKTVRLGESVDRTGRLSEHRVSLALETLEEMAERARRDGVTRMIGVATEAVRVASNGADFLREVTRRTGIELTLISGDQEAALTYAGLASMRTLRGPVVMVDIGGASTEVVAGDGPRIVQARSIPLGSGRLTDAYIQADPPTIEELGRAKQEAGALLEPLGLDRFGGSQLILSGGTGEHLSQFLEHTDDLVVGEIANALSRMSTLTADELAAEVSIPPIRARVLPAGVAIALECAQRIEPRSIAASPSGLRIGLLQAAAKGTLA